MIFLIKMVEPSNIVPFTFPKNVSYEVLGQRYFKKDVILSVV
jgi:hypothetical protein